MNILLTNDDGFDSPGLQVLAEELASRHEIWIVAPKSNRSGASHSITVRRPHILKHVSPRQVICSGTPVDCVNVALSGLMDTPPELVLSGINLGPNLGTDIYYSGTAGAARQASVHGIPGIALSLNCHAAPWDFSHTMPFIRDNLEALAGYYAFDSEAFLNINFPHRESFSGGTVFCAPGNMVYSEDVRRISQYYTEEYLFVEGKPDFSNPKEGTDIACVLDGKISLSLIKSIPQVSSASGKFSEALKLHADIV